MPTLSQYDIVMTVLNAVKVRLNDEIVSLAPIGGKILKNTQYFSQQTVNDAWRLLQECLSDLGYTGLKEEVSFTNVGAVNGVDPLTQVSFSYSGYSNGAGLDPAKALPQDMIRPLDLWERPSGTAQLMTEMDVVLNGLPVVPHVQWNRQWEWRQDALWMPGATVATDIKIRYASYYADFADVAGAPLSYQIANTPWYAQPIPIMRCVESFADYCCALIRTAVGDMDGAAAFKAAAEKNARLVLNRDTQQPSSVFKASEFGKMADKFTSGPGITPVKRGQ